jgi:hypothetical protein
LDISFDEPYGGTAESDDAEAQLTGSYDSDAASPRERPDRPATDFPDAAGGAVQLEG